MDEHRRAGRGATAKEGVRAEDTKSHTVHLGTDPALEVNGPLFVDPNVDALKKIFKKS
jgi:hypothetical protein